MILPKGDEDGKDKREMQSELVRPSLSVEQNRLQEKAIGLRDHVANTRSAHGTFLSCDLWAQVCRGYSHVTMDVLVFCRLFPKPDHA